MKLVFPSLIYKDKATEFINEFNQYKSEINGVGGLDGYLETSSYEAWIKKVYADIDVANVEKPRVPALTYFYVREDDDRIIGMINIRLALNDFLKKEGGHIGYCIRPTERKKHYGTDMLRKALEVCDTLNIKSVLVTCDKSNVASANVIRNCNGELEEEFYSETFKEVIQRYVIRR